jgi:hypothetical protein
MINEKDSLRSPFFEHEGEFGSLIVPASLGYERPLQLGEIMLAKKAWPC